MNEIELNAMKCGIPDYMIEEVVEYLAQGRPTGDFLAAVINNNLREAVRCASDTNIHCLDKYINFFYRYASSDAWGYPEATDVWPGILERNTDT